LCDDIFGEENLVASFIVVRSEGGGMAKQAVIGHDYLLSYSRNISNFTPLKKAKDIRGKVVQVDNEDYWIEEDWLRKEFGKYGTCPYDEIEVYFDLKKKEEIDLGIKNGVYRIIEKNGVRIVGRLRKISEDGSKFYTILKHLNKNGVDDLEKLKLQDYFSYPKPVSLVKSLILGSTYLTGKKDEIILDFFSGSATTAHAVMQLNSDDGGNRKFITVQLPEVLDSKNPTQKNAFDFLNSINKPTTLDYVGIERIIRASKKIQTEKPNLFNDDGKIIGDFGFKHFILNEPNQNTLDKCDTFDKASLLGDATILDDFGTETVLTTWLNNDGYGLNANVETIDLKGYTAHYCNKHLYLINPNFTQEAMVVLFEKYDTIAGFNPENIVLFGYSFNEWSVTEMLEKNLKILNDSEKNLKINIDVRY
jgi:hypothetical protein